MVYDNYYNWEEYYKKTTEFFDYLRKLCKRNYINNGPLYLEELIKNGKINEVLEKYELNDGYYLYWLLIEYATKKCDESVLNTILIDNKDLISQTKWVTGILGSSHFKPYITNANVLKKSPNIKSFRFFKSIYQGKALGHCHKYSLGLNSHDITYVTAFIPSWFQGIRVLHTYAEKTDSNEIIDVSRNLVFPKNEFNNLVKPEVVSEITNKEFLADLSILKACPSTNIRDYLVNRQKILAKIKTSS